MNKAKLIGAIFGVILFIALIGSFTYAWVTWQSDNINTSGTSDCFDIDYGVSKEIGSSSTKESLEMVNNYTEGLSAKVSLALKSNCKNVSGLATLYLNTNSASSSILKGALKYTVFKGEIVVSEGSINTSEKITLLDNIEVNDTTPITYTVYVWLNGEEVDNSYANLSYYGYISAEAESR